MLKVLINNIVRWSRRTVKFFREDIWDIEVTELSKAKARFVNLSRIVTKTFKDFADHAIGFQTVALSYFCTMAFVPFIAVAFAVTNGFGLADKLTEILYSANVNQGIIDTVLNSADKILSSATNDIFGLVSALTFVWLVIWMMMRVETVFNNVWRVRKRPFIKSFGFDLVLLFLTPFVVLILYSGTIVYSHVLDLIPNWIGVTASIKSFLGWAITGVVATLIFSAMYKYIPAVDVKYSNAFKAAVIAGVAFTALQYLYLETQVFVMRLNAVYGTIAAIPLFMVWMRFGWLIIMYGAQFSYTFQTLEECDGTSTGLDCDKDLVEI